jgi:transcriptional regulator with XRE-family HTH domain
VLLAGVDIRARLGTNVRRLREAQGWSQEEYADRAGIHRTYVSDIERGRRNPTVTVVEKLAKPLAVPAGELLI